MPARTEPYPYGRLGVEVSLWSADLTDLGAEVARLTPYADVFHIDASDTRVVPSPLFFPDLVAALRPRTTVPFHVHVMAERALPLVEDFARAGADLLSVHAEAEDVTEALHAIRALGCVAGLALRLDTPIDAAAAYLDDVDFVVLISTPLGTKGTAMGPAAPDRVQRVRALAERAGRDHLPLVADGGIRETTVPVLARAGADAVVAGSLLMGSTDRAATTSWLRNHRRGPATTELPAEPCPGERDVPAAAAGPLEGWVVSVDLWGTLITYGDRDAEAAWRIREFETVLTQLGHALPAEQVREAILTVRTETRQRQRATGEQPPVRGQVEQMLTAMGVAPDSRLVDILLVPHTHAVLRACPALIPGAHNALRALRQAGARLVLTSNSLATPASVSRLILDDHDLTTLFDETVFSSDIGVAKPHPEMFAAVAATGTHLDRTGTRLDRVVHVGNSLTADVRGALNAGCRAVFFNPRRKPCPAGVRAITNLDQMPVAVLATCAA